MAAGKVPGPDAFRQYGYVIDDGTLARIPTPPPRPIGLYTEPKVPSKSTGASAGPPRGIRVHDESHINAAGWISKINASNDVPVFFSSALQVTGQMIWIKGFAVPKDIIHDDWFDDWPPAFNADVWEITTGCLEITVTIDAKGTNLVGVLNPDLSKGESIDGLTKRLALTIKATSTKGFSVEFGSTMPDGATLNSKRKLIVLADRVVLHLGDKIIKKMTVTDPELLNSWFHEISCHAGRNAKKKVDTHGDPDVERCAADIDRRIPGGVTTSAIGSEIDAFLKSAGKPVPAKQP